MKDHLKVAINRFSDYLSYESCNDYDMPNTPENRALWDEYQAWNLNTSLETVKNHADYIPPMIRKDQMLVDDGILIYCLKKQCGMLDNA